MKHEEKAMKGGNRRLLIEENKGWREDER